MQNPQFQLLKTSRKLRATAIKVQFSPQAEALQKENFSEKTFIIPLIEHIIRKGMGKLHRQNLTITPEGKYHYKPSHAYFEYVSKVYPLKKRH